MTNLQTERLGTEKITKLLLEFSLPATIGMLVNAVYNVMDRIFVGNSGYLGTPALAGITVAFPITMIMLAFAIMIGVGGATQFSIHLGKEQPEEARNFLGNAVILMVFFSMIFSIFGLIFIDPLLKLFGASDTVLPYAREYLSWLLLGAVFQTAGLGFNHFMRANGSPTVSMVSMLVGSAFDIVFDAVLIFVFHMGLAGAAIASVGGQALATVWGLVYFLKNKGGIRLNLAALKPDFRKMRMIITTGIPAFIMNVIGSLLQGILNSSLVKYGGDLAQAAMGIVNSVQTFLVMPVIGVNQGVQPIVSFNFGAGKLKRAQSAIKTGMLVGVIITAFGWLLIQFFAEPIAGVFHGDAELVDMAARFMRQWFAMLFVIGAPIIGSNYFQSIGKPLFATFLTLLRQVIVLIPLILILPRFLGLYGITWASPIADTVSAIVSVTWVFLYMRKQRKEQEILGISQ